MKLSFSIDQAKCLRRGVDCPRSNVTIQIDPTTLSQGDRNLIADRLRGNRVCKMVINEGAVVCIDLSAGGGDRNITGIKPKQQLGDDLIIADGPTFQDLMAAIREDQKIYEAKCAEYEAKINQDVQ